MMSIPLCPCFSGKFYAECCQIYHSKSTFALTPEQLMRSRYSAYAMHLVDYLWETIHPAKRHLYDKGDIEKWAKANHWVKLEIVTAQKDIVEFKAFYQQGLNEFIHHERSVFKKNAAKWYYFSGEHFQ